MFSWLLSDYVKVSNIATDQMLYTEKDIEASMDRIETVNFHQETEVGGVKFWCYNAGHVLGAAMFMIEIAGVKVCELMCILCTTMSYDNMTTNNKLIFAIICFITFCVIFRLLSTTVFLLLWSPYVIGQTIIFLPCGFYLLLSFFLA